MFEYMFGFCLSIVLVCFIAFGIVSCIYYFLIKDILRLVRRVVRARRIRLASKNKTAAAVLFTYLIILL